MRISSIDRPRPLDVPRNKQRFLSDDKTDSDRYLEYSEYLSESFLSLVPKGVHSFPSFSKNHVFSRIHLTTNLQ